MVILVLKRLAQGLLIVWLTTTITFVLIHAAPGEPFASLLENPQATEEDRAAWRASYGLDEPVGVQYATYLRNVVTGDFGTSLTFHRPVIAILADTIPRTLLLMATALVLGFATGMALGAWQASHEGSWFDRTTGSVAVVVAALPDFWLALIAVMLFAGTWFPVTGFSSPLVSPSDPLLARVLDVGRHLIVPASVLALLIAATVSRYQRAAVLDALPNQWLLTARAKGAPRRDILFRHALRNALLPTITLGGLAVPALLGGAVFVEQTFAWPGMGSLAVNALNARDYPVVLAVVVVSSSLVVLGAALADILHAMADPRLRRA